MRLRFEGKRVRGARQRASRETQRVPPRRRAGDGTLAVAVLGALLSVIALGYYLRIIVTMWMQPLAEGEADRQAPSTLPASVVTGVCAAGVLFMGLMPGWFIGLLG